MRVVVFGGGGRTGRELIVQLLARGHDVTAVLRHPERFGLRYERLAVVRGDVLEPRSFGAAVHGQDAVLSALGVTGFLNSLRPMTFHRESARAIIDKMHAAGVSRLVLVSSVGVLDDLSAPIWYRAVVKPLLRHKYEDMRAMEALAAGSDLNWTVVRAARLVDGSLTQHYRIGREGSLAGIGKISRSDLADFVAQQVTDAAFIQRAVAISY